MSEQDFRVCVDRIVEASPLELTLATRSMWQPGSILKVRFLDGEPAVQATVEEIAHKWSEHANIKFDFGTNPDAEIRITFTGRGSWSFVGKDALSIPKDEPTMNYGWLTPSMSDEECEGVVLHEFGHALGCVHEHQHPEHGIPWNKPAVYRYFAGPPNFWSKTKVDRNLFQAYSVDQTQFSSFDPQSIMIYPIPKELTDGVFEVGWNNKLSDMDKAFIGTVYPFEVKPITALTIGAPATKASIGKHGEEDSFKFTVSQIARYRIETEGPTDVVMGLYGPDDENARGPEDDDSGRDLNARIVTVLTPGVYYLRVRHYQPSGTGTYGISVRTED
jgi:hypothetical protein